MENEPIRVLHIVPNMQAGGLETLIMNIYRNIDRTKVQFDFLVHYTGNYFYDDEIRSLGGRIYKLSVRDDNNFIKYLKDLDAFFKKHPEYKIVHGHMESLGQFYFKAAKKDGVPVRVAHSHNSATENTFKGKIKGLLLKRYKVFATDYFACSQKAGEFMFANKKFTVLKNAIIVNNFIYNENERNRLRKELGIEGKIVIGHAGRFCEQKNHKFLIDVFKKIADLENNAVLLLIGAGETFEKVKEQVCEYGLEERVIFLGVRKDIASLYQAMDCFVFPSLFEGRFHAENHLYDNPDQPIYQQGVTHKGIEIGDNCWIGAGVVFLDGAKIGNGCVVAANAVVTKSFGDNLVIGGIPAKKLRDRVTDNVEG